MDSDSSTSDTLLLFATGQAAHPVPQAWDEPVLAGFRAALEQVLRDLAQQVVRDGEGASKLITIAVDGARSDQSARADRACRGQLAPGQDRDRRRGRRTGAGS